MLQRFRNIKSGVPDFLIMHHRERDTFGCVQPQPVLAEIQFAEINQSLPDVLFRILPVMLCLPQTGGAAGTTPELADRRGAVCG